MVERQPNDPTPDHDSSPGSDERSVSDSTPDQELDAEQDADSGAVSNADAVADGRAEPDLDAIFGALAHPTRRALIEQVAGGPQPVGELAEPHDVSLAAVSKHLQVLEDAGLIDVETDGRVRRCHLDAAPLSDAFGWLTRYRVFWEDRFDALAAHLEEDEE